MESDLFCEDYYTPSDEKCLKLAESLAIWKKYKQVLYPSDVLNIMIDLGMIRLSEVQKIIDDTDKNNVDMNLPSCYIK
jgi:intergrase/recombinase